MSKAAIWRARQQRPTDEGSDEKEAGGGCAQDDTGLSRKRWLALANFMSDYLKAVQERVVIFDGAMGTCIQGLQPSARRILGQGRLQRRPCPQPS
jgi:hypothetical protein